jgi:hypothetical protein
MTSDPILALLPAERLWAFDALPFEEQQWRARVFLAVWINTGGMMFAWAQALRHGSDDAEVKAWVLRNLTDEVILDGLRSLDAPETDAQHLGPCGSSNESPRCLVATHDRDHRDPDALAEHMSGGRPQS